jgi:hypothetical protein
MPVTRRFVGVLLLNLLQLPLYVVAVCLVIERSGLGLLELTNPAVLTGALAIGGLCVYAWTRTTWLGAIAQLLAGILIAWPLLTKRALTPKPVQLTWRDLEPRTVWALVVFITFGIGIAAAILVLLRARNVRGTSAIETNEARRKGSLE